MESIRITEADAARRQLDVAIALLFAKEDFVAVHTLAIAAAGIAAGLMQQEAPAAPWSFPARPVCGLDEASYFGLMRKPQDFLPRVDRDQLAPNAFSIADTVSLLSWTIFELGELGQRVTLSQSVFQLWNVACKLDDLGSSFPYRAAIRGIFGNLSRKTLAFRLAAGRQALLDEMDKVMRR